MFVVLGYLCLVVILLGSFTMGVLQWTGRSRSWYERPDPVTRALNELGGASPLMLILFPIAFAVAFLGLILGTTVSVWFVFVLDFGIAFPLFALFLFIGMFRPGWANPRWMRDVDRARANPPVRSPGAPAVAASTTDPRRRRAPWQSAALTVLVLALAGFVLVILQQHGLMTGAGIVVGFGLTVVLLSALLRPG
jgi:hypothetical protein